MNNKKGFTLIELLAVVVILSIIMIIAVPRIMDTIDSSKSKATESSRLLLKDAIETQIVSDMLVNNSGFTPDSGNSSCYTFDFTNKNTNVDNLYVTNKEQFLGSVKYCTDGKYDDSNLEFSEQSVLGNKEYIIKNGKFINNSFGVSSFIEGYQTDSFGSLNVTEENGYLKVVVSSEGSSSSCKSIKFNSFSGNYSSIVMDVEVQRDYCSDDSFNILGNTQKSCNIQRQKFRGKFLNGYRNDNYVISQDCFRESHTNTYKIYDLYIEK